MKNLQSRDMPLRTIDQFYCPIIKQKSHQGIRVYRDKLTHNSDILLPKGESGAIVKYVGSLNAARQLPRKIYDRQYFYPSVSPCRRHNYRHKIKIDVQMSEQHSFTKSSRRQTVSIPTNTSTVEYSKGKIVLDSIKQKDQVKSQRNLYQSKQMRLSFYNTLQKSDYFTQKFREDVFLEQRKTNTFQNMLNRTITARGLLEIIQGSKRRLREGVL